MSLWAVIPAKGFEHAKTRLDNLDPKERAELARALFEHTFSVVRGCELIARILVATDSSDIASYARERNATVMRDRPATNLGQVIDRALQSAVDLGATSALILMADLPRVEVSDVRELVSIMRGFEAIVVPDRHDRGTNALGLTPPLRLPTCFGNEDSFQLHCERAYDAGARYRVHRNPRLAFDVDLPADVIELRGNRSSRRLSAGAVARSRRRRRPRRRARRPSRGCRGDLS